MTVTNLVTATSPTAATPVTATVDVTVRQPVFGAVDLVIELVVEAVGPLLTYTLVVTNLVRVWPVRFRSSMCCWTRSSAAA